jgi:hypothetical protein
MLALARGLLLAAHSGFNVAISARHAIEVLENLPILLRISRVGVGWKAC